MRKSFLIIGLSGLATLFLTAPGIAGDCCKGKNVSKQDCCKTNGGKDKGKGACCKDVKGDHKMSKLTEFSFHQTGGIMGLDRKYSVKLADMDAKQREQLEKLIAATDLLKAKSDERITKGAADMFVYEFTASEDGKIHSMTFDDGTITEAYRAIVAFAKDKMVDQRRR